MAENEIRNQIKEKEEQIKKLEEEATIEEAKAENELEKELDPRISEIESKLTEEQNNLDTVAEKYEESKVNEKEVKKAIKTLIKEIKAEKDAETVENQKIQDLEAKLESEKAKLGEVTANFEEWKINYKELKKTVKSFAKEAKNLNKEIRTLEFKSLNRKNGERSLEEKKKYKGDALITAQTETYLLHKSVKQKIKLIYNNIISSKIPLETAEMLSDDEEQKIMDILNDSKARKKVFNNQEKLKSLANHYFEDTGRYGLYNVVITSFDLSPIIVFGEKYSFEEIEVILRNIGEIPHINPMKWKLRQSFINEKQVWIFLVNSGVGVTIEGLFEPYFYLLITDLKADLGESYNALTRDLNHILG